MPVVVPALGVPAADDDDNDDDDASFAPERFLAPVLPNFGCRSVPAMLVGAAASAGLEGGPSSAGELAAGRWLHENVRVGFDGGVENIPVVWAGGQRVAILPGYICAAPRAANLGG